MAASAQTESATYYVTTIIDGEQAFNKYMTVKDQTSETYSWQNVGSTKTSLVGYAKTITINGVQHDTASGTDINISNVVNSVSGESDLSGATTNFISVNATNTITSGINNVQLVSSIKTQDVSTASSANNGIALAKDVQDYVQSNLSIFRTYDESDLD